LICWIYQCSNKRSFGQQLIEQLQLLWRERPVDLCHPGHIAARRTVASNQTTLDRIDADEEYDWNCRRCGLGRYR
jgi:hypothetical protein